MSSLLVILADVEDEPNWQSVKVVLQRHMLITQTLVYTARESTSNNLRVVLFCSCCVGAAKMVVDPPTIYQDLVAAFRHCPVEHRLYESLIAPQGISTLDAVATAHLTPNHILVMNAMTPTPSADKTFNDWYSNEHIPLLRRVPSWMSSERFLLVSSTTEQVPQYLALHRWNDIRAFHTAQYKAATNTPWRTSVIAEVIKKERLVLKYEGTLESLGENTL